MAAISAEETAPAETVMDAFYQKAAPSGSVVARPGDDLAALKRAQLLAAISQAPHTRAGERFRATGDCTGELRQDWRGAFVRHTYRPHPADRAGCSLDNRFTHHSAS